MSRPLPLTAAKAPQKISVKPYIKTTADCQLVNILVQWREAVYTRDFVHNGFLGPLLVMPDSILQRIVGVARTGRLSTIANLREQTGWTTALFSRYGADVLRLVHEVYPPEPTLPSQHFESQPADENMVPRAGVSRKDTVRVVRCSACGGLGHIRMYFNDFYQFESHRCIRRLKPPFMSKL